MKRSPGTVTLSLTTGFGIVLKWHAEIRHHFGFCWRLELTSFISTQKVYLSIKTAFRRGGTQF